MMVLFLFLLLVIPYLLLALVDRSRSGFKIRPSTRARIGLSLFFIFTAIGHFVKAPEMSQMLPPSVPYRLEIIYVTGVFELLGAIGVCNAPLMRLTRFCIILMLICFLPANIYSAMNHVDFGGHGQGPGYLLFRVPFQFFVMWWTYYATKLNLAVDERHYSKMNPRSVSGESHLTISS
jgi:uncharacterized membrane protein